MWRGKEARLYVHYEDDLQLYPATDLPNADKSNTIIQSTPIWKAPFENLRHTADDGIRLLWLDIGSEEGETVKHVYRLLGCLKISIDFFFILAGIEYVDMSQTVCVYASFLLVGENQSYGNDYLTIVS